MTWITWISKLSKTKKRWENHRKYLPNRWNGARKTNNHAVLGDLLEDGLLLSDVSAMSQRCLPSSPCRRGVCKMPLEGRDGFQTSDEAELNPPCFHHDFITMNFSSFSSHQDFLMDSWWIAWFELIATFFLIRTTISVWKKRGESAGYINQLRLLYQGVRWVWPFRSEVKQGFEPSFTSFLRHARRILKLKDMKGVNHCKLLEE